MLSAGDVIASWRCSCLRDAPFISFRWILTILFLVSSFEVLIFIYSLRFFGGRAKPEDTQLSHLYSWGSPRARGGTELVGIPFVSSGFCCIGMVGLESSEEVKTSVCSVFCSCPCSSLLIQERDLGWMEALQLFFFFFWRLLSFPLEYEGSILNTDP